MNKLDKIRDELAYEYGDIFPSPFRQILSGAYSSGWNAAMEQVRPLVEALERISKPCVVNKDFAAECDCLNGFDCSEIAKSALEKFKGKENWSPTPEAILNSFKEYSELIDPKAKKRDEE